MSAAPCPFYCSMRPRPLRSTRFPYTTLFRSVLAAEVAVRGGLGVDRPLEVQVADDRGRPQVEGLVDGVDDLGHRNRLGTEGRSEEHTSELQSHVNLVCRLLLEQKHQHSRMHV